MNYEQHYGELTSEIRINGIIPEGNSMPINTIFLAKKFKKEITKSTLQINNYMNACFEKPQSFNVGETLTWELLGYDLTMNVYVIEDKKLFVKGKHFWVYALGIVE